ncbi:MAG: hypothetical protein ACOX87_03015 [Chloroflexota bacterium]|jgi:hypothetical protein
MCGSSENCELAHHGGQACCKEECKDKPQPDKRSYGNCGCGNHPAGGCCCSDTPSDDVPGGSVAEEF